MFKPIVLALVASAATFAAGAVQAGNVSWSIGINTPVIGTMVSNAPPYYPQVYVPAPRLYLPAPEPIVYLPEPAYYSAVPIYAPRQGGYYRPLPVIEGRYAPAWRHDHDRWDDRREWRHEGHHGHHDD